MHKFNNAIISLYEDEDSTQLVKYMLHSSKIPGKHKKLRKSVNISEEECNYISQKGLVPLRKDIEKYIESFNTFKVDKTFPIKSAGYATGLCCRPCMSVCYCINEWKVLNDKEKEQLINTMMKWIHEKYMKNNSKTKN